MDAYVKKVLKYWHVILFILPVTCLSQGKLIKGVIKDAHSDERIPFASISFKNSGVGKLSDSAGNFAFRFDNWPQDSIEVTYVGYQDFVLRIDSTLWSRAVNDVLDISILLERGKYAADVVVKAKIDRGWLMWRRIVRRKPFNDRYRFQNFSYELYNKLEVDLKNVKKDKFGKLPFVRKFNFIFNNIDTTEEGKPFLPVYLTEAISDYYFQKNPLRRREVFKANKTIGINNESVAKFLGGMDQNVNFYSNFIPVFDKEFISPISDNGDAYYRYKVLDSQFVNGRRLIHLQFTPKRKGQSTFEGDCWIHDTTFAVQKMNLRLSKEANINFVDNLSLIQEYSLINDTTWFLTRDKFVVDLSFRGENKLSAIARKSTTYKDIVVNDSSVVGEVAKNKLMEETILPPASRNQPDSFWVTARHEELTKNEIALYKTIDTLLKLPAFKKATEQIYFLTTGYKNIGNYEIGPWYNWITYNVLEGLRLRFDLGTNKHFSKKIFLHAYAAYGFGDKQWKYQMNGMYLFKKNPRLALSASYKKDIDYGQQYYDEISQDNIFAIAIRKSGVPIKFMMVEEKKVDLFKEWSNGFSIGLGGSYKTFDPLLNLPPKSLFGELTTAEYSIRLRYAFLERFLESTFNRISLGSPYPIVEFRYTKGVSDVFKSNYNYTKLFGSISDFKKIAPLGNIYYNFFGGKTYGTLPFMLLDIAPGNEIYYYNKYAFNLMNRYEFLHDKYAGINVEHNIGNGLFRFIPLTRKLKFRQFWSAKALWGSLSDENKKYNMPNGSPYLFSSLDGNTYLEVGTGVDNIFKVFRLDFVWRLLPQPLPPERSKRFGIFGSFRLAF